MSSYQLAARGQRAALDAARELRERTVHEYVGLIAARIVLLGGVLAQFGRTARVGSDQLHALGDAGGSRVLTEVSRGIDQWLWFVDAHQHEKVASHQVHDSSRSSALP